jgi:hypothetical protein
MVAYSHVYKVQESEAVAKLPDLSAPSKERQKAVATGTNGAEEVTPENNAKLPAKPCTEHRVPLGSIGQQAGESAADKGKTLARFHTEEEVAAYHSSAGDKSGLSNGETTKKHCIVEFERGTDNCRMLADFDTSKDAAEYYQTVKDKHEPFGPFLVLALELQPGGDYDDLQRKPQHGKKGSWGRK